jgi:hypothetical protein
LIPIMANSLWLASCLPEYWRFRRGAGSVADEQAAVLRKIIAANAGTEFGRAHGFQSIRSVQDFQRQVPLRSYDDHQSWIARTAAGERDIVTSEPVKFFEVTSGSTGGSKLVPYTKSLQEQFQRGIQSWVADLLLHHPDLMTGCAYWSVSPAVTMARRTSGGIPIGFDSDTAYLGGRQQRLVDSVMAVPGSLTQIPDMDQVRYLTLLFLVSRPDLKLISVWNPTFLSLLMEHLPQWGEELVWGLERGTISRGAEHLLNLKEWRANPTRARDLKSALRCSNAAERHAQLWPCLRLISCWADANAASPSSTLQALFPQAEIQGKGLLATEGMVSFPLVGHTGTALSLRSHFFEFLPIQSSGAAGSPELTEHLMEGQQYAVVITTGGGLYRYLLGDLIEVTGHFHGCPLIRFLGRHERVSDWFGEKLHQVHVSLALRQAFAANKTSPAFAMLACDSRPAASYVLYIDSAATDEVLDRIGANIEDALCNNFHYSYARRLGQIGPLRVFRAEHAAASYLEHAIASGQRAGNVKPEALDRRDIWWKVFRGQFVFASSRKSA